MPWSEQNFPPSWKNFAAPTRCKMAEIANALLKEGYPEERAIAIATEKGKEWAENHGKPVRKPNKESHDD